MRKYVLRALSLYLDFITVWAIVGLAHYFVADDLAASLGRSPMVLEEAVASAIIVAVLKFFDVSVGDWLLARAVSLDLAGSPSRLWANLLLGTIAYLSGLKELVRWTMPGDGMPFLFMVEETQLKLVALTIFGGLYLVAGLLLLRFAYPGKALNAGLLAFAFVMTVVNIAWFHDDLVRAMMERQLAQGLEPSLEKAEDVVRMGYWFGPAFLLAMSALLYLCWERYPLRGTIGSTTISKRPPV